MATPYTSILAEWHPGFSNQHRNNLVSGKRKADDDLESQSNISSQFKKLRLNHAAAAAISHTIPPPLPPPPPPSTPIQVLSPRPPTPDPRVSFRPHIANTDARPALPFSPQPGQYDHRPPPPTHRPPTLSDSDFMTVDDAPHRIIIHDLESEIAQIEADEAAAKAASATSNLFLADRDIDKQVSRIPQEFLQNPHQQTSSAENLTTALVLYRDPSSISVPEEEDMVRKTIIAARTRAREKQAEEQRERERQEESSKHEVEFIDDDAMTDRSSHGGEGDEDPDAMDIE